MSALLQIRDVPDGARRVLKARAARAGKSLNRYLLDVIDREVARPTLDEVLERVQQRAEKSPVSSLDVIEEARDQRSSDTARR